MMPVDTASVNDTQIGVSINGVDTVQTTGVASGQSIKSGYPNVSGNTMYLYKSRPYFAVDSASPSGTLTPSSEMLLAIFDVTAEDTEDITFASTTDIAIDSQLEVRISSVKKDCDGNAATFTLKDQDGNVLDTDTLADLNDNEVVFDFSTRAFTVPAGQTKKLYLYADTTDWEDDGDTIQAWLSDDDNANCTFGINGAGTYQEGEIIFRGDIYAGSFVRSSS